MYCVGVKCTHKLSLPLSWVHFVSQLTRHNSLRYSVTLLLSPHAVNVFLKRFSSSTDFELLNRTN